MNDTLIIEFLAFVGALIPIIAVIVRLNSTITKLNLTIEILAKQMEESENSIKELFLKTNDHETRISLLENRRK